MLDAHAARARKTRDHHEAIAAYCTEGHYRQRESCRIRHRYTATDDLQAMTAERGAEEQAAKDVIHSSGSDIIGRLCGALKFIEDAKATHAATLAEGGPEVSAGYRLREDTRRGLEQVRVGIAEWRKRFRNARIAEAQHECHSARITALMVQAVDGA